MAKNGFIDLSTLDAQFAEAVQPTSGFSDEAVECFRTFVREGGFEVDNRLVDADAFYWLDPLYDLRRSELLGIKTSSGTWLQHPSPKYREGIMLRKSSQGGATVFSILFLVWLCIDRRRGLNVGCFWPNEDDVIDFVQMRFVPLLESSEKMRSYIQASNVNNTRSKQIGNSNLWFRYVNGKSKTDSVPLDVIVGDEVRLWGEPSTVAGLMQRMEERFGQSDVRLKVWMSTVGSEGDAMETLWRDSNQVKYFTTCPSGCVTQVRERAEDKEDRLVPADEQHSIPEDAQVIDGICLSDWHPHKITTITGPKAAQWCCPCCGAPIDDVRVGPGFIETFPDAPGMYGLEFARTLYNTIEPFKLRREHDTATDKKQFWNGWMAKPYRDPKGSIIKEDHIRAAREDSRVEWHDVAPAGMKAYLGADFRTNEIHVVILGVAGQDEDNNIRGQVLEVKVLQNGEEAYKSLEMLLFTYDIQCGIIDYRPHTTTTLAMARRNEHRLFLASYVPGDMIRLKKPAKASESMEEDVRERNIVLLDRTKSLKYSLNSFAMGNWKMSPEERPQRNFVDRKLKVHDTYDVGWEFTDHLVNIALDHQEKTTRNASREVVGVTAQFAEEFVNVNYDPHFVHAFNYAVMASYMQPPSVRLIGGTSPAQAPQVDTHGSPMVPSGAMNPFGFIAPTPTHAVGKRCGTCRWWQGEDRGNESGRCERLGYLCRAMDTVCHYGLYRKKKSS